MPCRSNINFRLMTYEGILLVTLDLTSMTSRRPLAYSMKNSAT